MWHTPYVGRSGLENLEALGVHASRERSRGAHTYEGGSLTINCLRGPETR